MNLRHFSARLIIPFFALCSAVFGFDVAAQSACKGLSNSQCGGNQNCTWVSGFTRRDGVKVSSYCRAKGGGESKKSSQGKKSDLKKEAKKSDGKKESSGKSADKPENSSGTTKKPSDKANKSVEKTKKSADKKSSKTKKSSKAKSSNKTKSSSKSKAK